MNGLTKHMKVHVAIPQVDGNTTVHIASDESIINEESESAENDESGDNENIATGSESEFGQIIIKVAAHKEVEAPEIVHINLYSILRIKLEVILIGEDFISENEHTNLQKFKKIYSYKVIPESMESSTNNLECLIKEWFDKIKYETKVVGIRNG